MNGLTTLAIIITVVLAVLIVFARSYLSSSGGGQKTGLPYQSNSPLLTPAEVSFLSVLDAAVEGRYRVMAQVRLADILKVRAGLSSSEGQTARNRIQSKHIDFLLCRPSDLEIEAAIELDDSSHRRAKRKERDDFVDAAFISAGIPLHRFPVRRSYSVEAVKAELGLLSDQGETVAVISQRR